MSKKICVVLVEPEGYERPYALNCKTKLIAQLKEKGFLGQSTTVWLKSLEGGSKTFDLYVNYDYFEFLTVPYVIEALIQAEKEGFDAATVACTMDPGLEQAREILTIPVVGITEAVFALSQAMGARRRSVGIVAVSRRAVLKLNSIIDSYGFRSYVLASEPVRAVPTAVYLKASTNPTRENVKEIMKAYVKVAKGLIDQGAQLLITGCGGLGPLLETEGLNEIGGIPVLDPISAGIKIAELLIDYKEQSIYKCGRNRPVDEEFRKGREDFRLPSLGDS